MTHPPIGIDLGTTNSLIAVFIDGQAKLLANAAGALMTPSAVALKDDRLIIGQAAWDRAASDPKTCATAFKRSMGTDKEIPLGPHRMSAPELSSLVLKKLKEDAQSALGQEIQDVVISVPAYFNQIQRQATQTACQLAGLNPLALINEPTAAALAYGLTDRDGESQFMVLDLGGGTFDVTVLEHFEGVMEVKASSGDAHLGGEDFTRILRDLFLDKMALTERDLNAKDLAKLTYFAEQAKRALSKAKDYEFSFVLSDTEHKIQVTETLFESAAEILTNRLRRPIHRSLYDNQGNQREIDRVILVGGATRMPLARKLAARELGLFPDLSINPDHAVALGAAIQAGLIADDQALSDIVMTDVSPFSVGIETSSRRGRQVVDGIFSPIIERNTPLPASRVEHYQTMSNNQKNIRIALYQGEAARVKDNILLGEFQVHVPPAEAGKESISVRITYDVSGLIEVIGTSDSNGSQGRLVVETSTSKLDDAQIQKTLKALEKLKIHPKDDEANIALMQRLERLYEMTTGESREEIAQIRIDFEAQLLDQDPRQIDEERQRLNQLLDKIDEFYVS